MAASPSPAADYFAGRPAVRTRPPPAVLGASHRAAGTPGSPRTPLLGRSISSQFGTPGSFRAEQEEHVIYELGARHLSAGFAGESRPRCVMRFEPESGRRVGDYRGYEPNHTQKRNRRKKGDDWGAEYELYRNDVRALDLGLVEDKLGRAVRTVHANHLQLDQKPRKAVLAIPSLLPTPLLEIALKVLFNHYTQPPSIMLLTAPILATVGAGLRHALVVDVGWEETVVTAVGEYKEVFQRRSVRAGKMLTQEMSKALEEQAKKDAAMETVQVDAELAGDVTERMGWCRPRSDTPKNATLETAKRIPLPGHPSKSVTVPFSKLAEPAETALFATNATAAELDDHDLPLHQLAYNVLLALPLDLRAICISRIVITGGVSKLPGLKHRLLQDIQHLVETRRWDPIKHYGSATTHHQRVLSERNANISARKQRPPDDGIPLSPAKKPIQDSVPHSERLHDDIKDPITFKAERHASQGKAKDDVKNEVRGVETLGAWAGASLVASVRVKGVHEVEREEFLKHGLRDGDHVY
ncbi:hypothetical protein LTR85_011467 [Meristemomyces frigidus]|nr:hypothetical protein LTR85_011467 [Meristemomyces frigidus]